MNYAFNEDHISIIDSKEVLVQYNTILIQYNTILNEFDEKQSVSRHRFGGYLKINFAYNYELDGVRARPILILHLIDNNKDADTVTLLSDDDNGRILGPFPSGYYYASMVTMAGKTRKKYLITTKAQLVLLCEGTDFIFLRRGQNDFHDRQGALVAFF